MPKHFSQTETTCKCLCSRLLRHLHFSTRERFQCKNVKRRSDIAVPLLPVDGSQLLKHRKV